jgi:hypothetical protein
MYTYNLCGNIKAGIVGFLITLPTNFANRTGKKIRIQFVKFDKR